MKTRVVVHGARELRRDIRRIDKDLPKQLTVRMRRAAEPVRVEAARLAPRKTGKLSRSLKVSVRGGMRVAVYSRVPYAPIVHWGGRHPVFGNREAWVPVRPSLFIQRAATHQAAVIERQVADEVEDLMRGIGFK